MTEDILVNWEAHGYTAVKEALQNMNAADIADEIEKVESHIAIKIFRALSKDKAAEVFAHLSGNSRETIIEVITDKEIKSIVDDMFLSDAVDFVEEMPANVVKRVLKNISKDRRDLINTFLCYPKDSVGSVMTIEYISLKAELTASAALVYLRKNVSNKDIIHTCYVTDRERRLIGTVSATDLLLASPDDTIRSIMQSDPISTNTTEDQGSLTATFLKYDLLALPVVDSEQRLVGIVTVDDVLDVQQNEATKDFEIMAAISPTEKPYLKTDVFTFTKKRVVWLLALMLSATVTGSILSGFEEAFTVLPALVFFIPMLMNTGGSAGTQSATLVIRGIALNEIALRNVFAVLWKELRVAMLCGAILSVVNLVRVLLFDYDTILAITVSLTLFVTVLMAKTVGGMLPIAAKKLGADPAVMASPIITTILDASTLVVYFMLAKLLLGI
ncbi:MAG: magnesium transporter [Leptospirales bacterium]|nr:magnesium transporter [Leptospirales bacterium]